MSLSTTTLSMNSLVNWCNSCESPARERQREYHWGAGLSTGNPQVLISSSQTLKTHSREYKKFQLDSSLKQFCVPLEQFLFNAYNSRT
jgi:hypothetical protein